MKNLEFNDMKMSSLPWIKVFHVLGGDRFRYPVKSPNLYLRLALYWTNKQ